MSNPHTIDAAHWEAAMEHYHWDRLEEAYDMVRSHGVGEAGSYLKWFRLIEAETITRKLSRRENLGHRLMFEYVPEEVYGLESRLMQLTIQACDDVSRRLGWNRSVDTLVAILAEETDAPWATNPFGYYVSKEPYEKICLPNYLVDDPEEFRQAVAHEYAHVISNDLSDEEVPRWMDEAIAVLAERQLDQEAWEKFSSDDHSWMSPDDLEHTLESRGEADAPKDLVWLAYQQCGWIGRYLTSIGSESRLADLLREHSNDGFWRNLSLTLKGHERVDGAMWSVYRKTVPQLFEEAYKFLKESRR